MEELVPYKSSSLFFQKFYNVGILQLQSEASLKENISIPWIDMWSYNMTLLWKIPHTMARTKHCTSLLCAAIVLGLVSLDAQSILSILGLNSGIKGSNLSLFHHLQYIPSASISRIYTSIGGGSGESSNLHGI